MMARGIAASVEGTPSGQQMGGLLMDWLHRRGRLTMPQAARLCCNRMLGDWNCMPRRDRRYWIRRAQCVLENLSRRLPIYNLRWRPHRNGPVIRVWYLQGKEPMAQLEADLQRPNCDTD